MNSCGINRETGEMMFDLDHTIQSFIVICTTRFGERVLEENFGSYVPDLLGRQDLTQGPLIRFFAAISYAAELWEPRLRFVRMLLPGAMNSIEKLRTGRFGMAIEADYRPLALQGDILTGVRRIIV